MRVMMIGKATAATEAGAPPTTEAIVAMHQFNEELQKAGVLVELGGLTPSSRGVRVRSNGVKHSVTDGPFAEVKELIAGYLILEVKNLAEAIEWAKRSPFMGVTGEEMEMEIRPLFGPEDFDPPAA